MTQCIPNEQAAEAVIETAWEDIDDPVVETTDEVVCVGALPCVISSIPEGIFDSRNFS